jgi:hypothetical protein
MKEPQFRKTVAKVQDFVTGEVVEMEKMKPMTDMKGSATIQLFDKDGKELKKVQAENFISQMPAILAKQFQKSLWGNHQLQHNYDNRDGNYEGFYSDDDAYTNGPTIADKGFYNVDRLFGGENMIRYTGGLWNQLYLTDCQEPEEPLTELMGRGNLIAYTNRWGTYSGTSNTMGSLNINESFANKGHLHYVFDWPTNSGNGTFQSLVWAHGFANYCLFYDSGYLHLPMPDDCTSDTSGYAPYDQRAVFSDDLRYCAIKYPYHNNSNDRYYSRVAMYEIDWTTMEATLVRTFNTDMIIGDMSIDTNTNDLWVANTYKVRKYQFADGVRTIDKAISSIAGLSGYGYGESTSYVYYGGVTNKGADLYVATYKSSDGSPSTSHQVYIARIDKASMNLIELYGPISANGTYGATSITEDYMKIDHVLVKLSTMTKTGDTPWSYSADNFGSGLNTKFYPFPNDYTNGFYVNSMNVGMADGVSRGFRIGRVKYGGLGARNLLPAPVEKTSQNTMKITYDFVFDIPPVEW